MSSETWQEILRVLALLPWVAFFVAIVWFKVLDVRDDAAERGQANAFARSEKRIERRRSASLDSRDSGGSVP
jgi:hypothetical protein